MDEIWANLYAAAKAVDQEQQIRQDLHRRLH